MLDILRYLNILVSLSLVTLNIIYYKREKNIWGIIKLSHAFNCFVLASLLIMTALGIKIKPEIQFGYQTLLLLTLLWGTIISMMKANIIIIRR